MSRGTPEGQARWTTLAQVVRANGIHEKRGPACKWNPMAFVLLKLAYFTSRVKFHWYGVSNIVRPLEAENRVVVSRVYKRGTWGDAAQWVWSFCPARWTSCGDPVYNIVSGVNGVFIVPLRIYQVGRCHVKYSCHTLSYMQRDPSTLLEVMAMFPTSMVAIAPQVCV